MDDFFQFSSPAEAQRAEIVRLNERRYKTIVSEHEADGTSYPAIFISEQLPSLDPSKRSFSTDIKPEIRIVNADTFVAARELMNSVGDDSKGSTAVLNMASDEYPGGGYMNLCIAQEEALCYTSTLYHALLPLSKHYPWPNKGPDSIKGIFSPSVVIFRNPLHSTTDNSDSNISSEICAELPPSERRVVSVISVAAPRYPLLNPTRDDFKDQIDKENLREKVRFILRMAGLNGKRYLVLGALGCGAYRCPPLAVAREIKSVIQEPEFSGWFKNIVFAVYSSALIGSENFDIFKQVFEAAVE
ncbi:hypothetical protein K435DRAFT_847170 [Dendrothele bispora CBS 962.96]|uniref:Microbial-type PARG catalytic domain-containing protein n=1 Tax=Dendrothele bispora (strain CBS 962.96) TaxID=1314807 RepID=A0A4S8MZT9_DENBC|nr:hypothetical protein K435DRAFT_847170 [Dendrothele bispora CBS 962.96]